MKRLISFYVNACFFLVFLFCVSVQANDKFILHEKSHNLLPDPGATFEKIWIDYDVTEESQKGMRIHVKFTANDMLNLDALLAIYFEFNNEKAGWLKDKNNKYTSSDGFVAVYKDLKPLYNPALYSDLNVFMPYSEFDLDPGKYEIKMDVKLIYKAGGLISRLTRYNFEYTKPGVNSGEPVSKADATFEDLWVEYNITQNGQKGMLIHVKFRVLNLKDADCNLALYFETKNGEKLKSEKLNYKSASGQLAIYTSLKPGYDEAVYKDLQLFLPYVEIQVSPGRHDLKLDADVIYKNGDLVKHLKYYDFWIDK